MVLWQHIVLCKSTLLGMRLAYGVRPVLLRYYVTTYSYTTRYAATTPC